MMLPSQILQSSDTQYQDEQLRFREERMRLGLTAGLAAIAIALPLVFPAAPAPADVTPLVK